ncbi:MAG: hypothetical protein JNG89_09815 [Planctomycetaceae bacterium]|nr:hypothetical protein [Planctomycetaceae bacterium]
MLLKRCRAARAPWVALCLAACLQAGGVRSVSAQEPLRLGAALSTIPTELPDDDLPYVTQVAGEDESDVRERLRVDVAQAGSSSKDELARAFQRLPLAQLSDADRRQVDGLVRSPSLFRRLPTVTCRTDARVYSYFVENPDVAVSIWRVMGVSDMQMRQVSASEYETDLNDGTVGAVKVLHRSANCVLVLCSGDFKSPLLAKPIRSTGLMCLQSQAWQSPEGLSYVTHTGDVFVVLHSDAVEAIARLISPMSFKMADKNFEEVTLFVRMMDEAMARQPAWIERTASRMDGVIPGRDKELLDLAAKVYVDARRRELQQTGGPVSLDAIRPPVKAASGQ